jgi:hypothetical protein
MPRRFGCYEWVTIGVVAVVAVAATAQAIREHSWQPIWQVGWLPAVLVASLSRPRTTGDCRRWVRRRSDS